MRSRLLLGITLGVRLCLAPFCCESAWGAMGQGADSTFTPAQEPGTSAAGRSTALVGTLVAVDPESKTTVVDVPLGSEVLRVGAVAEDTATITAFGKSATLASLITGERVRITFRREPDGDAATAIAVLRSAQG